MAGFSSSPTMALAGMYAAGRANFIVLLIAGIVQTVVVLGWVIVMVAGCVPGIVRERNVGKVVEASTRVNQPLSHEAGVALLGALIPQNPDPAQEET